MRPGWSLIVPTLFAATLLLSFVCVSLAVPVSLVELERRQTQPERIQPSRPGKSEGIEATKSMMELEAEASKWVTRTTVVRAHSNTYRDNAMKHEYGYSVDPQTGTVSQKELKTDQERENHSKDLRPDKDVHADHVYELQAFIHNLEDNNSGRNLKYKDLNVNLQQEVKDILNGPANMAFIPKDINIAKGHLVGQAMKNEKVSFSNPSRDQYVQLSYPTALKTAKTLDEAFERHNVPLDLSFSDGLNNAMTKANILPLPAAAQSSSTSGASQNVQLCTRDAHQSCMARQASNPKQQEPTNQRSLNAGQAPQPKAQTSAEQQARSPKGSVRVSKKDRASTPTPQVRSKKQIPNIAGEGQPSKPRQQVSTKPPISRAALAKSPGGASAISQASTKQRMPKTGSAKSSGRTSSASRTPRPIRQVPTQQRASGSTKGPRGNSATINASKLNKPQVSKPPRSNTGPKSSGRVSTASSATVQVPKAKPQVSTKQQRPNTMSTEGPGHISAASRAKPQVPGRQSAAGQAPKPKQRVSTKQQRPQLASTKGPARISVASQARKPVKQAPSKQRTNLNTGSAKGQTRLSTMSRTAKPKPLVPTQPRTSNVGAAKGPGRISVANRSKPQLPTKRVPNNRIATKAQAAKSKATKPNDAKSSSDASGSQSKLQVQKKQPSTGSTKGPSAKTQAAKAKPQVPTNPNAVKSSGRISVGSRSKDSRQQVQKKQTFTKTPAPKAKPQVPTKPNGAKGSNRISAESPLKPQGPTKQSSSSTKDPSAKTQAAKPKPLVPTQQHFNPPKMGPSLARAVPKPQTQASTKQKVTNAQSSGPISAPSRASPKGGIQPGNKLPTAIQPAQPAKPIQNRAAAPLKAPPNPASASKPHKAPTRK